ncbi:amidohydrolase family protein [Flexivirga alba]|uniref:Amidohydrolase family protein n=1 Tax=Flexivirga alba TaxID=702742 RepID=A0ABW2AGQ8_9MICO
MTTTLIAGGRVVSPQGAASADVLIDGEAVSAVLAPGAAAILGITADRTIDASGKYVLPGGIDVHTHMDMPFGGTFSVDDFETGTRAAAWGGTTTIVDFPVQKKGGSLQEAVDTWHAKAEGSACIDYGFHAILADVNETSLKEMDGLVDQGVTSFKLFMAYPGVFLSTDDQIIQAMYRASDNGATIMMHAENGTAIDQIVTRAIAAGHTEPKYHGLTRPIALEAEAVNRATQMADVTGAPLLRAPVERRSRRRGDRGTRCGTQRLRRDLPAVPLPRRIRFGTTGFRGCQVCLHPRPAAAGGAGETLARPAHERPVGGRHRSLSVLFRPRQAAREGRLPRHTQWAAGC